MSADNNNDDSSSENTCVVCFKNVEIHSVGDCDHPVCYECSTRMRVLCRQNECPICRHDMQKVIFTYNVQPFKELDRSIGFRFLQDRKFKIVFENAEVQKAYNTLLAHTCSVCPGHLAFQTFVYLRDHMRKEHELFYCDLCVENLKILTHERRCYTRKELATHRRQGDADNRSHRGHPLCEFCNERYMDNDELYRHLRRDHLFCHFCDADGLHHYYDSYDVLRNHFRDQHYLCEEGDCYDEKFTSAFRSEIDLKAHRASVHGRQLGKAAAKQARTLELEFVLKPRPRQGGDRRGMGRGSRLLHDEEEGAVGGCSFDRFSKPPPPQEFTTSSNEFPTLGGTSNAPVPPQPLHFPKKGNAMTRGGLRQEDFPALGQDVNTPTTSVSLRVSAADRAKGTKPTNLSIHVNHRPGSVVTTVNPRAYSVVSSKAAPFREPEAKITVKPKPSQPSVSDDSSRKQRVLRLFNTNLADDGLAARNDFPALSGNLPSHISSLASSQWTSGREPEPKLTVNKSKPNQPPPKPPQPKTFHIEDDFPSLNSRFDASCSFTPEPQSRNLQSKLSEPKVKKESSLSIAMDNNWSHSGKQRLVTVDNGTNTKATTSNDNVSSDSDIGSKKGNKKKKSKSKTPKEANEPPSSNSSKKINNTNNNNNNNESGKKSRQKDESKSKAKQIKAEEQAEKQSQQKENQGPSHTKKNHEMLERKRSELKIDNLTDHSKPDSKINLNEFPSLSNGSKLPPGFTSMTEKTPAPPGFDGGPPPPPPGFSITLNSVARPHALTFTSSSGQHYPIPSADMGSGVASAFSYVPPPNSRHRNTALVSRVTEALHTQEAMEQFLQMSAQYRQGTLAAVGYYQHCREAMGADMFPQVFPELLVLLPDIGKQQELWRVAERPREWKLEVCAACGQVVMSADLKHHLATHSLENHFPALSNGSVAAAMPNAWTTI